jgi:hypothetical protein
LSTPKPGHVGPEALPLEESLRTFVESPDLQRHKLDADIVGGGPHGVKQGTGAALVVQIEERE